MVAGPQRRRLGTGDLRIRLISVCAPNKNQLKKQRPGALWHRGAILGAEKKDSDGKRQITRTCKLAMSYAIQHIINMRLLSQ